MSLVSTIPFNRPFITGRESAYLEQVITSYRIEGNGQFSRRCEALMADRFGVSSVQLTTSGTSALEVAALLCDLAPGDEVIMPSYTFASTANAFCLRGARIQFVDIHADTLNIDESKIESAIGPRTRVIVPVHYAGVGCEMDAIMALAGKHNLIVVEDAAQAVNASYRGLPLGTIGDMGCYSFHQSKNFVCGEGGAFVTNNRYLAARAEIIREKGTNRSQFFRGEVAKYTWQDIGSSYVLSDCLAALLLAQLEAMDQITASRQNIFQRYLQRLLPLSEAGCLELPKIPQHCASNYHLFHLLTESPESSKRLIAHLGSRGIQATFHYVPLHTSPFGERMGYRLGMLPITESCADRLVRLPIFPGLGKADVDRIVDEIFVFFRMTP